ncbi:S-layer homology domain-containing protein [Natronincola peptidivorans]|uniref:S-layer homology domain-containing protein n=1 Tax=Natronincola peptidivorans TaxID=426128 RepID=A0A1I0AK38_9FIRM|nr:S-layer homology domain-containing protein [Natronincola peptidivorans]SES94723.1 S-layer homology domain-containing protein [Natronincola peptidivorans]
MRLKKATCGLLVGGLLLSNASFVLANPTAVMVQSASEVSTVAHAAYDDQQQFNGNLEETKAMEFAKQYSQQYFQVDVDEAGQNYHTNINYREDWNRRGKYVWEVSFSRHAANQYLSIHITINDEDGSLIEMRKHQDHRNEENHIARYTREEAEETAYQFLLKMNPDLLNQLILDPRQQNIHYYNGNSSGLIPTEYNVFYMRQKNGIPVNYDGVQIGVNSGSGEVTSYRLNWSEEAIPDKRVVITAEEAADVFKENLDFTLTYVPVRDRSKGYTDIVSEVRLAYAPRFEGGVWVDATNGEMVNYPGAASGTGRKIDVTAREKESFKNLRASRTIHSKEMDREKAITVITKTLEKIYPDEAIKIENISYSSNAIYGDGNRRKTWSASFQFGNESYANGHITIDAITEEVLQLNYHNWHMREMLIMSGEEFSPSLEWEDAYLQAIELLKELYPEKLKNLNLEQTYHESTHYYNNHKIINPEYYFSFSRIENEITYPNNSIDVSVDSSDGRMQRVHYRWNDIALPKPQNLVAKEEMLDVFMQQSEAKLAYILMSTLAGAEENEIKLVYTTSPKNAVQYNYVDAHTGVFLDYNGQEVKMKDGEPISIEEKLKGHWAERELRIMTVNGVIDLEVFDLKDEVIKNEIIKTMVKAMGHWYPMGDEGEELKFTDVAATDEYYEYIRSAVNHKFIDNEARELQGYHTVSKEAFAEMLIKMTPLEKAAAIEGIYQLPVKDTDEINPEKIGAVALLYGLDILKGEGDTYQPKKKITLEEAATAIYQTFNLFGYNRR